MNLEEKQLMPINGLSSFEKKKIQDTFKWTYFNFFV